MEYSHDHPLELSGERAAMNAEWNQDGGAGDGGHDEEYLEEEAAGEYDEDGSGAYQNADEYQLETAEDPLAAGLLQMHMDGAGGAEDLESLHVVDTEDGGADQPGMFKVGEAVARTRGVISCIKCDRTNGHVYLGSSTGDVVLFDFNHHRELWRRRVDVGGRPLAITCIDIRHTKLALGGARGETVIYDLQTFTVEQTWLDHTMRVSAIAWVGDAHQVYTTAHDGYFLVRDAARKGKILHSFITCTCPLSAMQVESPNVVYIGSFDGQVKKLDLERKQVLLTLKANLTKESPIRCFALAPSPAAKKKKASEGDAPVFILFIAHGVGEIKSWDMRTGQVHVESYAGCSDVVNSMTTWNGKLYAAGDDKYVRMFDVNSGVCLESLSGHDNGVTSLEVCGVTPIITPEMAEAAASAAASHRSGSRKADRAASAAPQQQGVGNELLLTTGFDGQARAYRIAAVEAAIQLKLLKAEEQKQQSFEDFLQSKKPKGKKGGSRKGSAKKKGGSSKKKKSAGAAADGASKKKKKGGSSKKKKGADATSSDATKGSSKKSSKAGSKVASARAAPGSAAKK